MINDIAIFVLFVVAAYDLWLVGAGQPTISQAYQRKLPTWADMLILVPVLVWIALLPVMPAIRVVLAALAGHVFFPNKETWRRP